MPDVKLEIAASLDLPESLAPYAAQLMQGIDALGSYPEETVAICRKSGISTKSSVLDLACGKGLIAVELAEKLGCKVTGVDASPDFIRSAKALAKSRGDQLRFRPRFILSDVDTFRTSKKYDVVIMLNLFPMEEALDFCRDFVRPGGLLILDDVTLAPGKKDKRWVSLSDAKKVFEAEGDRVLAHRQIPSTTITKVGLAIEHQVAINGQKLVKSHSRLRKSVTSYLNRLKGSRLLLTSTLRPTIFAVETAPQ